MRFSFAALAALGFGLIVLFVGVGCSDTSAASLSSPLDSVYFGNFASELAHSVAADSSDTITGGLGQPARRLLPVNPPVTYKSGSITFNVKVDPSAQNYVTFKFWGSDIGEGRLLLFSDGKEVGYRDQGDYDIVNQLELMPLYPGRFAYTTLPLPPSLTNGKSTISLTITAIGPIFPYGTSFDKRQKDFVQPSRGIYAAYATIDPHIVIPSSEPQGTPPTSVTRQTPGPETMEAAKARVNSFALRLASEPTKVDNTEPKNHAAVVVFMARAYTTPWCSAFNDPKTLQKVVQEGDAYAVLQSRDPNFVGSDWPGAGPLGQALMSVYPALVAAGVLDQPISLVAGKVATRRHAWADTLLASVDYWQARRRAYTNQSMIVDQFIYTANEGLRLLEPERALPQKTVLGYLYQAMGITPWLGSVADDKSAGGTDLPKGAYGDRPYGSGYYLVTGKGLSRELGYVAGYGETILHFGTDLVRLTGDPQIRAQLAKINRTRAYFRYPLPDKDGNRAMVLEAITDTRNGHYPADVAYGAHHGSRESEPMEVAVLTKDPAVIGMAQQELADNQYFDYLQSHMNNGDPYIVLGLLNAVDDYPIVAKLPQTAYRLPMTDGQPDFVWTDEGDAVVALKHGDQRLYFNFYYRAERAINGVVRIHDMTPSVERIVTAHSQYEYTPSGHDYLRDDWIDSIRGVGFPPPGETIHQAWAGEKMPIQKRPDDAAVPAYGDWGPFLGRADFYSLVYGDYIIGLNTNDKKSYKLNVPAGVKSAKDLATGKTLKLSGPITVAPKSAVVLYIER